jgi:hypothetical protein
MIAYVDGAPEIDLQGENFLLTVTSGTDKMDFVLTAKAFFILKSRFAEAYAKRCIAEMDAKEKVIKFSRKSKRSKR